MSKSLPARMTVVRASSLTPHMRRIVLGGDGFDQLVANDAGFADHYVKLVFLAPGAQYPDPLDLDVVRETMPSEAWPVLRTYTVREVDPDAREVTIDFVVHGDDGLAGPWAAAAEPGDVIHLRGPGGAYSPDPAADHVLLAGDEAALPAIASVVEALADGARATAFVEVDGPAEEQAFVTKGEVEVHWLHRDGAEAGSTSLLDDAVRSWGWPDGRVQVFLHGESSLLRTVRPYVVKERGVARDDLSVSAYWRRGATEEAFRDWKRQSSEQPDGSVV